MHTLTKLALPLLAGLALTACQTTRSNNKSHSELVAAICDLGQAQCACWTNQLEQKFTEKEWVIFASMVNGDEEPAKGTTINDMIPMAPKLENAKQFCKYQAK